MHHTVRELKIDALLPRGVRYEKPGSARLSERDDRLAPLRTCQPSDVWEHANAGFANPVGKRADRRRGAGENHDRALSDGRQLICHRMGAPLSLFVLVSQNVKESGQAGALPVVDLKPADRRGLLGGQSRSLPEGPPPCEAEVDQVAQHLQVSRRAGNVEIKRLGGRFQRVRAAALTRVGNQRGSPALQPVIHRLAARVTIGDELGTRTPADAVTAAPRSPRGDCARVAGGDGKSR